MVGLSLKADPDDLIEEHLQILVVEECYVLVRNRSIVDVNEQRMVVRMVEVLVLSQASESENELAGVGQIYPSTISMQEPGILEHCLPLHAVLE